MPIRRTHAVLAALLVLLSTQSHAINFAITRVDVNPATVNTALGDQTIAFTLAYSSPSVLASCHVDISMPNSSNADTTIEFRLPANLLIGSASEGSMMRLVQWRAYSAKGQWKMRAIRCFDINSSAYTVLRPANETSIAPLVDIEQVGEGDVLAPTIVSASISPLSANVTAGAVPITVTLSVRDDLSGVASCQTAFTPPSGSLNQNSLSFQLNPQTAVVSGTKLNMSLSLTLPLPQFSRSGNWTLLSISCVDVAGRSVRAAGPALSALLPQTVIQVSGGLDTRAPTVTKVTVSPVTIDTSSAQQSLFVTVAFTDDLAGLAGIQWFYLVAFFFVSLVSYPTCLF